MNIAYARKFTIWEVFPRIAGKNSVSKGLNMDKTRYKLLAKAVSSLQVPSKLWGSDPVVFEFKSEWFLSMPNVCPDSVDKSSEKGVSCLYKIVLG